MPGIAVLMQVTLGVTVLMKEEIISRGPSRQHFVTRREKKYTGPHV
ncbi:MAG TPA: hypothetical protein VEF06_06865 [Bryobacteraceae bacterium]|nr:hypothetical protein [Bryobacteraceae bacterium]